MSDPQNDEHPDPTDVTDEFTADAEHTLAEDLLLLLFQPDSGTIAGEGTLYYVLAGAVLADLGLAGQVDTRTKRLGSVTVEAVADAPPTDGLLRASWDYVAEKPRGVQTVLAATGPVLREPLLDRLVERGDLRRRKRKTLGLFETSVLEQGDTQHRAELLADVRSVLVDGAEPTPRTAALAALLYASGTLPQFHREIPWTSEVITRAEELKRGNWGATAAGKAVARTIASIIAGSGLVAATTSPGE